MLRNVLILLALAATPVAAQTPAGPGAAPKANPPGPVSTAREAVEPWITANVHLDGWKRLGANTANAFLIPLAFAKSPDGKIRTQIRLERFEPETIQNFAWRSAIQGLEIDCAAGAVRYTYLSAFPALNLEGSSRRFDVADAKPTPTAGNPAMDLIKQTACATAAAQWPADPLPPIAQTRAGLLGWLAANIDQAQGRLASLTPAAAVFVTPGSTTTPEGWRETKLHAEFLKPAPGPQGTPRRSEVTSLALDCAASKARIVSISTHVPQNLGGAAQTASGATDWRPAPPGSPLSAAGRLACGAGWVDAPAAGSSPSAPSATPRPAGPPAPRP